MFYVCNKAHLFVLCMLCCTRRRVCNGTTSNRARPARVKFASLCARVRVPMPSEPPAGVSASARTCAVCGHSMLAYGIYVHAVGVHRSAMQSAAKTSANCARDNSMSQYAAREQQPPPAELMALNNSGAVDTAAGAPESFKSASDDNEDKKADNEDKKAQRKERKRINDQNRRAMRKLLAQQATDGASLDLTVASLSDLQAFMREQKAQCDQLRTGMQTMLQNCESVLRQFMAIMHSQPCTGAVGGAAVGTKKKRRSQKDADTTGPAKSKKPCVVKKPEPRKELSVTPASPGPSSQLASQPTPEAQTQHAKTCKLSHCDNEVEGDAEFCEGCSTHLCRNGPQSCDKYAKPGKELCEECEEQQVYCDTVNCPNAVSLAENFCTECMEHAGVQSDSSVHSSDREDNFDSCAQCNQQIPNNQVYCTGCNNQTSHREDETESDDSEDED